MKTDVGYVYEYEGRLVTRQRLWQIRQMADGRCRICGRSAITKEHCERHRLAANARDRTAYRREKAL